MKLWFFLFGLISLVVCLLAACLGCHDKTLEVNFPFLLTTALVGFVIVASIGIDTIYNEAKKKASA